MFDVHFVTTVRLSRLQLKEDLLLLINLFWKWFWWLIFIGSLRYTPVNLIGTKNDHYTIIEWFRGIHWKIFARICNINLAAYQPLSWYCKFLQNIFQCIPLNHSIIVLSHRLLIAIINHHFIEKLLKQNKLINRRLPAALCESVKIFLILYVRCSYYFSLQPRMWSQRWIIDLERWILTLRGGYWILSTSWSDVIGQIHLSMWQNVLCWPNVILSRYISSVFFVLLW